MPFGLGDLGFIDDAINSVMDGLDDLFTSEEERKKARKKLEQVKNELKLETQAHVRKMAQIHAKDRQHARSVQQKSLEKAWWMMPTLAILAFLGFFGVLTALMFVEVPETGRAALNIMLGSLGSLVMLIGHFLWGSSQGSKDKADHLRELTNQIAQNSATPANSGGGSVSPKNQSQLDQSISKLEPVELETKQAKPRSIGW